MSPLLVPREFRRQLDAWFPTVVRYLGVGLMVSLVGEAIFRHLEYPSLIVAASGMILYKTVVQAGKNDDED